MKKRLHILFFILLSSSCLYSQWMGNWEKDQRNPVLSGGGDGKWDKHVFTPMVLFNPDSSRYEMYYNGSYGPPNWRPFRIGVAYSQDLINWEPHSDNPVLEPTPGSWDQFTVEEPFILYENGLYHMWYWGSPGGFLSDHRIGHATSPDGINWTKDALPVLTRGIAFWENNGVWSPFVIKNSNQYTMYYSGFSNTGKMGIGRAFSSDGLNWIRDTINNPVLEPGGPGVWDEGISANPCLLNINDTLYMWYAGAAAGVSLPTGIGQAFSLDGGATFIKDSAVIKPDIGAWDGSFIEFPSVNIFSDTIYLWYDGSREPTETNLWRIGLARTKVPIWVGVKDDITAPQVFYLEQNYPNPFNPNTRIKYSIPNASKVTIKIFNTLGEKIETLINEEKSAGTFELDWNAANLPSGIYFYQLKAGDFIETKKMILMK